MDQNSPKMCQGDAFSGLFLHLCVAHYLFGSNEPSSIFSCIHTGNNPKMPISVNAESAFLFISEERDSNESAI